MNAARKLDPKTNLERAVARWLNSKAKDYKTGLRGVLKDLENGCESGIVSHLIYTKDTVAFYKRHRLEICELVTEYVNRNYADSPSQLFTAGRWDKEDPFALEDGNQNLLAWFAFEEKAWVLGTRAGM